MIHALLLATSAADLPISAWATAPAAERYASAFQPEKYQASARWVAGYFTVLNTGWDGTIGHTTDLYGIIGEIKLVCDAAPPTMLIDAASRVYGKLKQQKR